MKYLLKIKRYVKLTGIMAIAFVIMTGVVKVAPFPTSSFSTLPYKTIELQIEQRGENNLFLESAFVKQSYPLNYSTQTNEKHYEYEILDKENKVLTTGIFNSHLKVALFRRQEVGDVAYTIPEVPLRKINLFLPVYVASDKVQIKNKNQQVILSLNLESVLGEATSRKVLFPETVCGNGICDINENFLSCHKDCKLPFGW